MRKLGRENTLDVGGGEDEFNILFSKSTISDGNNWNTI